MIKKQEEFNSARTPAEMQINELVHKINELVDFANNLRKELDDKDDEIREWLEIVEALRKSNNIHEKQIDELQMKLEPEKCVTGTTADKLLDPTPSKLEEVLENIKKEEERKTLEALTPDLQDLYAEQRKWIWHLCRFWFDDKKQADIGILGEIDEYGCYPYWNIDLGHNYKCCEPVKPDDDIIYKGEQQ